MMRGWMPENRQLAYSIGPVSVPEQIFPEREFFVWNSFGPRIGVTYDVFANGRTVVKSSYGLFWDNPGPDVSADANPNQNNKSVTYNWNDANGDKRFQLGEQVGAPTNTTLAGTIQFDPKTTQPYSHDFSAYLEQQLPGNVGSRIGFVYKTEDDLISSSNPGRPISAYTVSFPFTDIGLDGVSGTADDRVLTLKGVPSAQAANFPITNVTMNTDRFSRYKTVEASMVKRQGNRWTLQVGGSHTWALDFPGNYPNDPNGQFDEPTTRWDFKVSGSYEAPFGIRISPLVRHQAGQNFARQISVGSAAATAAGAIYAGTIYAEPRNARRQDNITVFDVRVDKAFTLKGSLRLRLLADAFNITNSNAVETRTVTTGTAFLRPTAVLSPRTFRVGARLSF
jgi:hypothetical protein